MKKLKSQWYEEWWIYHCGFRYVHSEHRHKTDAVRELGRIKAFNPDTDAVIKRVRSPKYPFTETFRPMGWFHYPAC